MELQDALAECRLRLARHRKNGSRVGEQNTKAMLIEPSWRRWDGTSTTQTR